MKTVKITYIGKNHLRREIFFAPRGTLNTLRNVYLVDITYNYN